MNRDALDSCGFDPTVSENNISLPLGTSVSSRDDRFRVQANEEFEVTIKQNPEGTGYLCTGPMGILVESNGKTAEEALNSYLINCGLEYQKGAQAAAQLEGHALAVHQQIERLLRVATYA